MNWRHCLLLTFLNGIVLLVVFQAQHVPGYMDASYYFIGGQQLAKGEGFVDPILWNYLGDPAGLPHPSHGYWMPFASMIAVLGMTVFNNLTFASARFGFILFALAVPILTAFLSYQLTNKSEAAI